MIAKTLNLPSDSITPTLQLPMKLIWGRTMLGLGDIVNLYSFLTRKQQGNHIKSLKIKKKKKVIPGLLVTFVKRFDNVKRSNLSGGYFLISIIGYGCGMFVTMIFAFVYKVAQPALLYLVPFTLLPIVLFAYKRNDIKDMWSGSILKGEEEPKNT